jgi:hypothetical protein
MNSHDDFEGVWRWRIQARRLGLAGGVLGGGSSSEPPGHHADEGEVNEGFILN